MKKAGGGPGLSTEKPSGHIYIHGMSVPRLSQAPDCTRIANGLYPVLLFHGFCTRQQRDEEEQKGDWSGIGNVDGSRILVCFFNIGTVYRTGLCNSGSQRRINHLSPMCSILNDADKF
jgi:hypothetical protein